MKFRWKIALTTMGIGGLLAMGCYLAAPTGVNASLTPEQKERLITTNEISNNISKLVPKLDPGIKAIYVESIYNWSKRDNHDPCLVVSIIYRESGFNAMATSSAGCVGAMQINPKAHPEKVKEFSTDELYYIDNNVRVGCSILKEYYAKGKIREALRRYVGGDHPTYVNDVLSTYAVLKLEKE